MRGLSLMAPLGWLYGAVAATRRAAYRRGWLGQARLAGPVISVGNLSVGGSGKTPVVALVASVLAEAGHPVAVLSRGYRGSFKGEALIVSDGQQVRSDAQTAGDEPVMLARSLTGVVVAVGARRDRLGRLVEASLGNRVHVLDDGFQHLRLRRDLDLLCLAPADLRDRPLPAGRLREWPAAAGAADAVVVAGDETDCATVRKHVRHEQVFQLSRRVRGFFDLEGREHEAPRRPFGFCGIARPERFHGDLAARASERAGTLTFRDHHPYSVAEVERIARQAATGGADALVTTAKDAVRLPAVALGLPLLVLEIEATVEPHSDFRRMLLETVERRRRETAA